MEVKFKLLSETAKAPTKAHTSDAGFDLYVSRVTVEENGVCICHSDVAFEIPEGYVGLLFPRSSIVNCGIALSNSVGVIDSGYRGEVMAKFYKIYFWGNTYKEGDRFGQLIILPIPNIELIEAEELSNSDRGTGGYGSSGK